MTDYLPATEHRVEVKGTDVTESGWFFLITASGIRFVTVGVPEGEGAGRGGRALGSPRWWLQVALGTGQVPGRMGAQGHGWAAHRPAGGSEDRGPQRAPKPESSGATWP